jgi:lysylphosphatidylglycerol synthetase-like protein (DUF2156 family)
MVVAGLVVVAVAVVAVVVVTVVVVVAESDNLTFFATFSLLELPSALVSIVGVVMVGVVMVGAGIVGMVMSLGVGIRLVEKRSSPLPPNSLRLLSTTLVLEERWCYHSVILVL